MVFGALCYLLRMTKKRKIEIEAAPKEKNDLIVGKKIRPTLIGVCERMAEIQSEIEVSRDWLLTREPCSLCYLDGRGSARDDQVRRRLEAAKLSLEDVKKEIMRLSTPFTDLGSDCVEQCIISDALDISTKKDFRAPSIQRSALRYLLTKLGVVKNSTQTEDVHPDKCNADPIPPPQAFTASMPPKPLRFYGRACIVSEITQQLCSRDTAQSRIAILGSVGMGKTAVAVQVVESEGVAKVFKHQHRAWVSCEGIITADTLIKKLGISLGLKSAEDPSVGEILDDLDASDHPRLLILDQFETPWYCAKSSMERYRIQLVLRSLVKLAHVSILMTMRSNNPPRFVDWQIHHLPPLDAEACRKIYTDIYPVAVQDESTLDDLLNVLGYTPYAIAQMATHAQSAKHSLALRSRGWNPAGSMFHSDELYYSINQSFFSNPMNELPVARSLLTTLSLLPAGTPRNHLSWWAPTLSANQLTYAVKTLNDVALLATSGPSDASNLAQPISTSPLIRFYMQHSKGISIEERIAHQEAAFKIICDRKLSVGDPNFQQNLQDLTSEAANLHYILTSTAEARLQTRRPAEACVSAHDNSLLDSLLVFTQYQRYVGGSPDIAQLTIKLAKHLNSDLHLKELDRMASQTSIG